MTKADYITELETKGELKKLISFSLVDPMVIFQRDTYLSFCNRSRAGQPSMEIYTHLADVSGVHEKTIRNICREMKRHID